MSSLIELFWTGPNAAPFTLLYAGLSVGTIWVMHQRNHASSSRSEAAPQAEPHKTRSPLSLSALRDGADGLAEAVVFDLVSRGWLDAQDDRGAMGRDTLISRSAAAPPSSLLAPIEQEVWRLLESPLLLSQLIGERNLPGRLSTFCEPLERELVSQGLLYDTARRRRGNTELAVVSTLLAIPAVARFALTWPHSEGGAWLYLLLALMSVSLLVWLGRLPWRTPRGEACLEDWRTRYGKMRDAPHLWGDQANDHTLYVNVIFGQRAIHSDRDA